MVNINKITQLAFKYNFLNITNKKNIKLNQITFNLPPRNPKFIGRENDLQKIKNLLNKPNENATLIIFGLGGVGKTQLAAEFAHASTENNTYGITLWISAETPDSINNSYRIIAEQLQINPGKLELGIIQKLVHDKLMNQYHSYKILFILDNVTNNADIQYYLDTINEQFTKHSLIDVIITSRSQCWSDNVLNLDAFSSQEAIIFIKKTLSNEKETSINNLAKTLHYFPLALSHAVNYIKTLTSIDDYLEVYKNNSTTYLNKLPDEENQYTITVWKTFNVSLSKLDQNAQQILFISAYLDPDDIPIEFFDNLTTEQRMLAIGSLRNYSLITLTNNNKSFKIHRLLQEVVRLFPQTANNKNIETETYWLNKTACLLKNKFNFNYLQPEQWNLHRKYLIHARTLAEHLINKKNNLQKSGMILYAKVAMFMTHILISSQEGTTIWEKLIQLVNTNYENGSKQLLTANISAHFSVIKNINNKPNEAKAYLNDAISIYSKPPTRTTKEANDLINVLRLIPIQTVDNVNLDHQIKYDLSYALTQFGNYYNYSLSQYNEAATNYNKALAFLEEIKTIHEVKYNQLDTLYNISNSYVLSGDLISAENLSKLNKIKELADQVYPGHHQQAITYMALARLNHYLGNLNESTKLLESAYDIMKHMFSKEHFMINTLKAELGRNKYMLGDLSTAKQLLEESSLYLNNTNIVYWCWFAKFYLGRVYEALQEYDKALNTTKESVAIAQEHYKEKIHDSMKFQISQAELWPNYNTNKNTILQYLEKTLQFNIQLFGKNHYQTARYHYLLGQVLSNKNQKKQAIDQYTIASTILKTEKEKTKHSNLAKFIQHNLQIIQKKLQTIE